MKTALKVLFILAIIGSFVDCGFGQTTASNANRVQGAPLGVTASPRTATATSSQAIVVPPVPIPAPLNPTSSPAGVSVASGTNGAQPAQIPGSSAQFEIQAKDLLDANDKTINRVAQMYEKFATLITIFIGLLGLGVSVGAAVFAFFAFKSLRDFKKEWKGSVKEAETELGDEIQLLKDSAAKEVGLAIDRIRDNELKAHDSATRAETSAAQLLQRQDVLNDYLKAVDGLRAEVDGLREVMRAAGLNLTSAAPQTKAALAQAAPDVGKQEAEAVRAIVQQKVKPEDKS